MRIVLSPKSGKRELWRGLAAAVFAAALLSSCGGDGSNPAAPAPTYGISGSVTANSAALDGATMTLSGASAATTTTDASGAYAFTGLVNGNYTITPGLAGYTFTPASAAVTVNGADRTGIDFTAAAALVQQVACPGSGTIAVSIVNLSFDPAAATISANSVVKWTNNDSIDHTVTSTTIPANGGFNSSNLGPGSSVCFKFTAAGTYNYHCSIHPSMTGTITVQ